MGGAGWHVVVRLGGVETGPDRLFEFQDSWGRCGGQPGSNLLAGLGKLVERGEGVADHGLEVERAWWLLQRPEGFGTVRVEFKELLDLGLWEMCWHHERLVESTKKCQGVQPCLLEKGAQVRGNERR